MKLFSSQLVRMILVSMACLASGAASAQVAEVPADAIGMTVRDDIKVVYHIKTDEMREGVNTGIHEVLHLIEIYESVGIDLADCDIHVVFDGPAVPSTIMDPDDMGNPNATALADLAGKGISLEVCGQNLEFHGYTEKDLLPDVKVALGGQPRVIDLQLQGYAYFRF